MHVQKTKDSENLKVMQSRVILEILTKSLTEDSTLSLRRFLLYRNQSIVLLSKDLRVDFFIPFLKNLWLIQDFLLLKWLLGTNFDIPSKILSYLL